VESAPALSWVQPVSDMKRPSLQREYQMMLLLRCKSHETKTGYFADNAKYEELFLINLIKSRSFVMKIEENRTLYSGGMPSAISMAVMPIDHTSQRES
jgi:hypothetical protein